jgi:hypothetical protein
LRLGNAIQIVHRGDAEIAKAALSKVKIAGYGRVFFYLLTPAFVNKRL